MSTIEFSTEEIDNIISHLKWGLHPKHGFAFEFICLTAETLLIPFYEDKVKALAKFAEKKRVIYKWDGMVFKFIEPLDGEDYIEAKRQLLRDYKQHLYGNKE